MFGILYAFRFFGLQISSPSPALGLHPFTILRARLNPHLPALEVAFLFQCGVRLPAVQPTKLGN